MNRIVDAYLLLKQNNDPRNKIVEDGLQAETDPDAEGADDNGNASEVYSNGGKSNIDPDNQDHIVREASNTIESRRAYLLLQK